MGHHATSAGIRFEEFPLLNESQVILILVDEAHRSHTRTLHRNLRKAQDSSRARAAQMQHAARYHIIGFTNQNPSCARKMSERLEEILQRFKDDAVALERAVPDCHERKLALVQHAKECLVLGLSIE